LFIRQGVRQGGSQDKGSSSKLPPAFVIALSSPCKPKFNQNELERRPEFAPPPPPPQVQAQPQPQAGPSRPHPPPVSNQYIPPPPPRAASPLKTVAEADAELDYQMSEGFDGEFLDAGGESFFDIVDTSVEQ